MNEWIYSLVFPYIYIHMKLIITESKISNALHKYLNLSYEGFDNCSHNWADFNCGWGVCCDIYAIGFTLPKKDYDDYIYTYDDKRLLVETNLVWTLVGLFNISEGDALDYIGAWFENTYQLQVDEIIDWL